MASQTVIEARARRARNASSARARMNWFVEEVSKRTDLTLEQRVRVAVAFLQDRIVTNISVPVKKEVVNGRVVVTERSVPGEFPRADTTTLRKSIFNDVDVPAIGHIRGFVGTPVWYAWALEFKMMRSFLTRTFYEERNRLVKIIGGTPIA